MGEDRRAPLTVSGLVSDAMASVGTRGATVVGLTFGLLMVPAVFDVGLRMWAPSGLTWREFVRMRTTLYLAFLFLALGGAAAVLGTVSASGPEATRSSALHRLLRRSLPMIVLGALVVFICFVASLIGLGMLMGFQEMGAPLAAKVVVGVLLVGGPVLWVLASVGVAAPMVMLEARGPIASFYAAMELTRGHRVRIAAALLAVQLLVGLALGAQALFYQLVGIEVAGGGSVTGWSLAVVLTLGETLLRTVWVVVTAALLTAAHGRLTPRSVEADPAALADVFA